MEYRDTTPSPEPMTEEDAEKVRKALKERRIEKVVPEMVPDPSYNDRFRRASEPEVAGDD